MASESCIHALLLFFCLYLKIYSLPDSSFDTFCSPVGCVFLMKLNLSLPLLFFLTQAETGILDSGNLSAQSLGKCVVFFISSSEEGLLSLSLLYCHSDRYFWFLLHWRQLKSVVSFVRSASTPRSHSCFHYDFPTALNKDSFNQITFLFSFAFALRPCLFQKFSKISSKFSNLYCS